MLWSNLSKEAQNVLEMAYGIHDDKPRALCISVGNKAPYSGVFVTRSIFDEVRAFVYDDIELNVTEETGESITFKPA